MDRGSGQLTRRWRAPRAELLMTLAVALCYAAPLALSRYFPGLDLPWHAAIVAILRADEGAGAFLGYFAVDTRMSSYLTLYALVRGVAAVVGDVAVAMQVVIAGYVVAFTLSAYALLRAFAGRGVLAVLAAPAAYSLTLEFGFLTHALSYPMTFVLWAAVRRAMIARPGRAGPALC
ncbi:MAG: hypothetical protein AAGC55_27270, partial [Myxococcota bacterium]